MDFITNGILPCNFEGVQTKVHCVNFTILPLPGKCNGNGSTAGSDIKDSRIVRQIVVKGFYNHHYHFFCFRSRNKHTRFYLKQQIAKCITAALDHQGVRTPCEINVLVTDNEGIRAINNAYRKIDKATDVLSFPMFELTAGQLPASWDAYKDPDTGLVPLGDMAISLERAKEQAAEFGHSARREVGYLTIHSILHLLGYDHVDEGPMKKQMRAAEEAILAEIELPR